VKPTGWPYRKGYEAGKAGNLYRNPYKMWSFNWKMWDEGYRQGEMIRLGVVKAELRERNETGGTDA